MTAVELARRLRALAKEPMPLPGGGQTAERHRLLFEVACEDLSLARLAEAHWDAVSILSEAGHTPDPDALYGVWAAEVPGQHVRIEHASGELTLHGSKPFCSGAGLLDRALVTAGAPERRLVDVNLRQSRGKVTSDHSSWHTAAFAETGTATVTFTDVPIDDADLVGPPDWYLERPGFWNGACGPAACWAGGAAGLLTFAQKHDRSDPHTMAHLGALHSAVWVLRALLKVAGEEIDRDPANRTSAHVRALTLRHSVEQVATDVLRRFARAYGPAPLAFQPEIGRRYLELDLYLRQSHAERDLEALGRALRG